MKVDCKIFKGIEYVRCSDLPAAQQDLVRSTLQPEVFIKILIDGVILHDCIQYKDYCAWFDGVYRQRLSTNAITRDSRSTATVSIKGKLALDKA